MRGVMTSGDTGKGMSVQLCVWAEKQMGQVEWKCVGNGKI